ncbi:hypothetical protein TEA_008096 [Camellia sinensis var. sinensis]|uniref:3'-5' exonuclease domain-containing protein n=1 Tax=Camellia sinensis var. sinensis TaxID=542762 RepID=A0A4S4D8R3_CAMSN|nr:hypothetical protein TEA_008096 [Camellia sinensis var. sinensis]
MVRSHGGPSFVSSIRPGFSYHELSITSLLITFLKSSPIIPHYMLYMAHHIHIPHTRTIRNLGGKPIDYEDHLPLVPIHIVTHASQLPPQFLEPSLERQLVIGFDCEGVDLCRNGTLCIMQLAFPDAIYLVDAIQGGETLMKACKPALESSYITKVIHDCKRDSEIAYSMIEEQEGRARLSDDYISFVGLLGDPRYCVHSSRFTRIVNCSPMIQPQVLPWSQYVGEKLPFRLLNQGGLSQEVLCFDSTSNLNYHVDVGFHLEDLNVGISYVEKQEVRVLLRQDPKFWTYRPLSEQMVRAAADDVRFLLAIYHKMMEKLNQRSLWYLAVRGALYCRCFCVSDDAYADWPSLPTVPAIEAHFYSTLLLYPSDVRLRCIPFLMRGMLTRQHLPQIILSWRVLLLRKKSYRFWMFPLEKWDLLSEEEELLSWR